jgi:hypothetical protein
MPHGELRELFKDVYFVTGSLRMPGPLPVTFSRNMTVLVQDGALTLVNSVRLNEAGLNALDKLGKVEHVIRLAGFHGMDDPFYKDRYGAKVWAVKGQVYATGFRAGATQEDCYFRPDVEFDDQTELPVRGARLYQFKTVKPGEGLLVLDRDGGIVIAGDCLQNWQTTDRYFSLVARPMMRLMGFIKPYNLGPGWLKATKPQPREIHGILELPFQHVLPAHGSAMLGGAKESYRPVIERFQ